MKKVGVLHNETRGSFTRREREKGGKETDVLLQTYHDL